MTWHSQLQKAGGFILLALCACTASPPVHYHALASKGDRGPDIGKVRMLVELMPIAIPDRLDRLEMLVTAPGGQIQIRDNDRWAAPLSAEIRNVLVDVLWRRLQAVDVYQASLAASAGQMPHFRLAIRVEQFEAILAEAATMEASWSLRSLPSGQPAACRARTIAVLAGSDTDAAATALANAAAQMSELIGHSLETAASRTSDPCANPG